MSGDHEAHPSQRRREVVLRDREAELATIDGAVRRTTAGVGTLLAIVGPAGIGKTALLAATARRGAERGMRELAARGSELERDFGFGIVRQLLHPLVEGTEGTMDTVPARLAERALGIEPAGDGRGMPHGPDASFAVLHGLHQLVAQATRACPLLLIVDDAHDADPASLRFLAYLAARVRTMPVCVVIAVRTRPVDRQPSVTQMLAESGHTVLRPRPLSPASVRELVQDELSGATDAVCDACLIASGGNPFLLQELGDTLRETRRANADSLADAQAVLGLLPTGVRETVRARIRRLPADALRLAGAVAVMGDGSLLRYGAAIARLDLARAAEAADALTGAEILAPERPPRFLHPLIRTAVYGDLPPGERAVAHAVAARLLAADDAAPERIAAHLLATEPGSIPRACDRLRVAADVAVRRGAPEAAVTYLRRALEEPLASSARPGVLLELGEAEGLTQNPEAAATHLRSALESLREPDRRLRAALVLAEILATDGRSRDSVTVLERALTEVADAPAEQLVELEARLVNVARTDIESRQRSLEPAASLRRRMQAHEIDASVALAAAAAEEAMAGQSSELTADLAGRAIARLDAEGTFPGDFTVFTAVRCLLASDRFAEAETVLERAREQARLVGAVVAGATTEAFLGDLYLRTGNVAAAIDACRDALRRARDGWGLGIPAASAILAEALVERGELGSAEAAIANGGLDASAEAVGSSYVLTMLLSARGRARLARGDLEGALADLMETGRRQSRMAELNPALIPWRSLAARALALSGRDDEAVVLAEEEVVLARRFGAARALGLALVTAGELHPGREGENRLREAERILHGSPARLARAQARQGLGEALWRQGSQTAAREALTDALDLATACGATALQERALRQLRLTGARPRRLAARGVMALTRTERRVAEMAGRKMTNREIADEMYVSVRTIEFHLSGVFRKLGIASRRDLSADELADVIEAPRELPEPSLD